MAPAENCQRPATLTVNQTSLWEIQKKGRNFSRRKRYYHFRRKLLSTAAVYARPLSHSHQWVWWVEREVGPPSSTCALLLGRVRNHYKSQVPSEERLQSRTSLPRPRFFFFFLTTKKKDTHFCFPGWRRKMSKSFGWIAAVLVLAVLLASAESQSSAEPVECSAQDTTFELRTGYVFTAPEEILDTRPDTLQLSECIDACRANASCAALNFETGLCVLFRTNALDAPRKATLWLLFNLHFLFFSHSDGVGPSRACKARSGW